MAQAVFPEGGLTRDGSLRPPKLGLLSYMVSGFDPQGARDIVFVPVGLNYDRVLEDRILTAAASTPQGERPRFAFNPLVLAGLPGQAACGCASAAAGTATAMPASASAGPCRCATILPSAASTCARCRAEQRFAEIERLGKRLMQEVGRVVPALPVSLVATAVLAGGERGLSGFELKGAVFELMRG